MFYTLGITKGLAINMKKAYFLFFPLLLISIVTITSSNIGCLNLSTFKNTVTEKKAGVAVTSETEDSSGTSIEDTLGTPIEPSDADSETTLPDSGNNVETFSDDTVLKYTVTTKEINDLESDGKREIIAKYPYFEHEESEDIFYDANNTIKNEYVDFWINDFRDITDEAFDYMRDDTPGPLSLEIDYSIEYMDNRCISVLLYNFSYTGGAHPNTFSSSYNYDIQKRKKLLLDDLFAQGYDYLNFLSSYCYEDIKNKYIEIDTNPEDAEDWIIDGTDPLEPDNFKDFNLTADSLMITFDPYEVGPYVMGAFTVFVPYAEFDGNILYP
jgi:hypothetical protein